MNVNRIKEELQFITNTYTDDIDYLMYLLLKDANSTDDKVSITEDDRELGYFDENALDEWFDNL